MANRKKSWTEKLNIERGPEVSILENGFGELAPGQKMLVATPKIVEDYVRQIPEGKSVDVPTLRADLARKYEADGCCPLTTGIFLRIIAEAAWEQKQAGTPLEDLAPFWRVVNPQSKTAKRLTFGTRWLEQMRRKEGLDDQKS